jgi:hypothetical protein
MPRDAAAYSRAPAMRQSVAAFWQLMALFRLESAAD